MSGILTALSTINQVLTIAEAAAPAVASMLSEARSINATIAAAQSEGRDLTDGEIAAVDGRLSAAIAAWEAAKPAA